MYLSQPSMQRLWEGKAVEIGSGWFNRLKKLDVIPRFYVRISRKHQVDTWLSL